MPSINEVSSERTPLFMSSTSASYDVSMEGEGFSFPEKRGGLSLFFGVFVPCCLTIFSVILFLRLGFVLGQAGIIGTMAMLFISYFVVGLTILSISAISTNGVVKGGGAYYMISRSLGPEFGGSIGVIFFFANVCGSALYIAGFVEALIDTFKLEDSYWSTFAYSTGVLAVCLAVCLVGAGAFAKASFLIFLIVMTSIFSIFISYGIVGERDVKLPSDNTHFPANTTFKYTGFNSATFKENLHMNFTVDYSTGTKQTFQLVFAVLFNGCTGIMAGANISGDLANPSFSIPWGTMGASLFTLIVYAALFLLSAATCSRDLLLNDYAYLQDINKVGVLVVIGVFAATLSASLSNLIGASRILEAIARDNLLGSWLKMFAKKEGNPYAAVMATWFIAQLILLIGSINVIAPIVSMLFLLSYFALNLACFVLRIQASPNFRPTFKYFSWHTALIGAIGCLAVMFYADPLYAGVSIILMILLYLVIHYRDTPDWGDITQALLFHQVRKYLLLIKDDPGSIKYWRPNILFLVTSPRKQLAAAKFLNAMKKGGLYILGQVLVRPFDQDSVTERKEIKAAWKELSLASKLKTFVEVIIAGSVREGVQGLLCASGLGGLRANTIALMFPREEDITDQLQAHIEHEQTQAKGKLLMRSFDEAKYSKAITTFPPMTSTHVADMSSGRFVAILKDCLLAKKNIILLRNFSQLEARVSMPETKYIDIYPIVHPNYDPITFSLMLQMATILQMVKPWRRLTIRVYCIVSATGDYQAEKELVTNILNDFRIVKASVEPVVFDSARPFDVVPINDRLAFVNRTICANSPQTAVVFSYLDPPPHSNDDDAADDYINSLSILTANAPPTCLFHGVESVVTSNDNAV